MQENFVFLELKRQVERLNEMDLKTPAFPAYKGGEIDFYVKAWSETNCGMPWR